MNSFVSLADDLVQYIDDVEKSTGHLNESDEFMESSIHISLNHTKKVETLNSSNDDTGINCFPGKECQASFNDANLPSIFLVDEFLSICDRARQHSNNSVDESQDGMKLDQTQEDTSLRSPKVSIYDENIYVGRNGVKIRTIDPAPEIPSRNLCYQNDVEISNQTKGDLLERAARNKLKRQRRKLSDMKAANKISSDHTIDKTKMSVPRSKDVAEEDVDLKTEKSFAESVHTEQQEESCLESFLHDVQEYEQSLKIDPTNIHQRTRNFMKHVTKKYLPTSLGDDTTKNESNKLVKHKNQRVSRIIKSFLDKCMLLLQKNSIDGDGLIIENDENHTNNRTLTEDETVMQENENVDIRNHTIASNNPKIIGIISWKCFICGHDNQPTSRNNCITCGRMRNYKGKDHPSHSTVTVTTNKTMPVSPEILKKVNDKEWLEEKRRKFYLSKKLDYERDARIELKTEISDLLHEIRFNHTA